MTPKEKAKELFDKMYWHFRTLADTDICKQCALIAVEEIIKLDVFDCNEDWSNEDGDTREYWYEVKQEINGI